MARHTFRCSCFRNKIIAICALRLTTNLCGHSGWNPSKPLHGTVFVKLEGLCDAKMIEVQNVVYLKYGGFIVEVRSKLIDLNYFMNQDCFKFFCCGTKFVRLMATLSLS